MHLLSRLPKDVQSIIYRKLHELNVQKLLGQYKSMIKIAINYRDKEKYYFGSDDFALANRFNYRKCDDDRSRMVYTFNLTVAINRGPLPRRYWYTSLNTDMIL